MVGVAAAPLQVEPGSTAGVEAAIEPAHMWCGKSARRNPPNVGK
jgi:hypothetical protein